MKAVKIKYYEKTEQIILNDSEPSESWVDICKKFNDDVHRVKSYSEVKGYSGLYECFDDDNNSHYYLVEEDSDLFKIKHKHFLSNIGLEKE